MFGCDSCRVSRGLGVQVIFTAIPVLSAGIAITFLHEQPFHAMGWVGAALIVAAGLTIARSTQAEAAEAAAAAAAAAAATTAAAEAAPARVLEPESTAAGRRRDD